MRLQICSSWSRGCENHDENVIAEVTDHRSRTLRLWIRPQPKLGVTSNYILSLLISEHFWQTGPDQRCVFPVCLGESIFPPYRPDHRSGGVPVYLQYKHETTTKNGPRKHEKMPSNSTVRVHMHYKPRSDAAQYQQILKAVLRSRSRKEPELLPEP
jgi:hypothetical protein